MAEGGGDRPLDRVDGLGSGEVEQQRGARRAETALVAGHDHGFALGRERDRAQLPPDRVGGAAQRPGRLEGLLVAT
jgi:hypothetical protein